jgi:hypothetical protein
MKDAQPDWRHLSDILQELTSSDHRFRHAFNDSFEIESAITNEIESAIANAACSGEVAVRGRRYNDFFLRNSAFERVEKYLGPKAGVDISLNRIDIPDDGAALSVTVCGAVRRFTDAQADLRGVEKWIFKNALPLRYLAVSAEEGTPTRRGPPPKYDWSAIREEAFHLMDLHGDFSDDNPEWDRQARLEEELLLFCANKFGKDKEPSPSRLRDRDRIPCWLAEWRKPKRGSR